MVSPITLAPGLRAPVATNQIIIQINIEVQLCKYMKKKWRVSIPEDIRETRQDSFQDLKDKQGPKGGLKLTY